MKSPSEKRAETIRLNRERKAAMEKSQRETQAIVETGCCPRCGSGLRRNLSLTGWWQCEQFGDGSFRKDQNKPQCGWQGFTS